MARVKLDGYRCDRCQHEWIARDRTREPRMCPKCKTVNWDALAEERAIKPGRGHRQGRR